MQDIIIHFVASENETYPPELGQIMTYTGEDIPSGFLPCDGRLLGRKNYPELYKIIRTKSGDVTGSNTVFNLPLMNFESYSFRYIIYVGFEVATKFA